MVVYLGSMGWSYKQWPLMEGKRPTDFLTEYSKHFNSVEVNNTFYRIPRSSNVETWASAVTEEFRFAVKFPMSISHIAALQVDQERLEAFLSRMQLFGERLGPLLIQFPAALKSDKMANLEEFLEKLPLVYRYAIEFRHPSWFNDYVYDALREYDIALVNVEHPKRSTSMVQTTDFSYIRLEGDRKQVKGETGVTEIDRTEDNHAWAERISQLENNGRDVYCYTSKHYSGYPPTDILQISSMLEGT